AGLLAACDPVGAVVGAGAAAGVAVAEERPVGAVVEDNAIQLRINRLWFDADPALLASLSSTVNEGRVLLTGQVDDPQVPIQAIRLVWQVPGVREVINEIQVAQPEGVSGFARDTWISTQ